LLLCVFFFSVPAPPPDLHSFPTRRSSDLTLSTEPSSSAIRARAFTWVFTMSSQFTTVFAAAEMVLALRAMFTAGMMRETSPARRSEEHTSELQSLRHLVCRLLLEKKNK